MRARNINVSVCPDRGTIRVWNVSFDLRGDIPVSDRETYRKRVEKAIVKAIAEVEFPDDLTGSHSSQ